MPPSVYLVYGDDEYRVSEKAGAIVDRLVPEAERTFGLEIIEGRCDTSAEADDDCIATPEPDTQIIPTAKMERAIN